MFKARRDATIKVAQNLFEVEKAIDLALTRAAEFNACLPAARTDAKLSAIIGQDAFQGAVATFASLAEARQHIVETHKRLDEAKTRIGLRELAVGDGVEKPPLRPSVQGFRVVGTEADAA